MRKLILLLTIALLTGNSCKKDVKSCWECEIPTCNGGTKTEEACNVTESELKAGSSSLCDGTLVSNSTLKCKRK